MLDLRPPLRTGLITFWSLVFGTFYSGCCKSSFFQTQMVALVVQKASVPLWSCSSCWNCYKAKHQRSFQ